MPTVSETLPGFHRVLGSYGVLALAPAPIAGADYHKVLLDQIEALSSMVSGIGLRAK